MATASRAPAPSMTRCWPGASTTAPWRPSSACNSASNPMRYLLLLTILLTDATGAKPGFLVVVNQANPISSLSRQEVSDLFLKKTSEWPGLGRILPVDQPEGVAARESFNREIHRKSGPAIRAYWQLRIF